MGSEEAYGSSGDERAVYRTCPLCEATCGLEIILKGDHVMSVRGNKSDVFSRGYFCPKGAALKELHEDPDRLRRPLVKQGGAWREVDWPEAITEVERGLMPIISQYGPDAVAVYLGNPSAHTLSGSLYLRPLIRMLNSKNIYSASTVDQMPKQVAGGLLFGSAASFAVPDLDRTSYLLILGADPWSSNGSLCTAPNFPGRLKAMRDRGGKLVVLDPRRSRTAKAADEHLRIFPGTDPFFLWAIVRTLFEEGLASLGRLAEHVNGIEAVKELAEPFSPERVAPECGLEARDIRRLARELAAAPAAAVYGRIGTCTVEFGTMTSWLIDVVNVLTGNLDRPGGVMFPLPAHGRRSSKPGGRGFQLGRWRSRVKGWPEVCGEFPIATLMDEIETPGSGQVRALLTIAGNPVLSCPNGRRLDAALASLEFMVSFDYYLNETTRQAKIILPPPSPLESSHYHTLFYNLSIRNVAHYASPAIKQGEGVLDAWEVLLRLAMIVSGQGAQADHFALDDMIISQLVQTAVKDRDAPVMGRDPGPILAALQGRKGPDRMLDFLLRTGPYGDAFGANPDGLTLDRLEASPHGLDFGPLQPRVPEILRTPSAKIELAPQPIIDDLPRLRSRLVQGRGPGLVLVGRRHLRSNNSWMHNLPSLMSGQERCTLQVHPEDAARLGLTVGVLAEVSSRVGSIKAPVEITEDVRPGVVSLPHGWGHDLAGARLSVAGVRPGVNSNILTDEALLDPLSGTSVINGLQVSITPI